MMPEFVDLRMPAPTAEEVAEAAKPLPRDLPEDERAACVTLRFLFGQGNGTAHLTNALADSTARLLLRELREPILRTAAARAAAGE